MKSRREEPVPRRLAAAGQRGIALLLVVWLLALLTAVVGEFVFSGRVKVAAERNQREGLQAYALALAGYRAALAALSTNIRFLSVADDGRLLFHYAGDPAGTPAEARDVGLGGGRYSWRIEDEEGRVNINDQGRPGLVALLQKSGVEFGADRDTIVDSILDWRDGNREHRLNGAEEDYYRGLDPPYSCKDGPFDLPEELLLVRGMKRAYLFGGEEKGKRYRGMRDLITVYPIDFNAATAPAAVLEIVRQNRPTSPTPVSKFFSIVASGKAGPEGPERAVRAVVLRLREGGKSDITLIYWNDNYVAD